MASPESDPGDEPEWFKEAISSPTSRRQIIVRGCEIAFRRWGNPGDPLVILIHGAAAHSRWWDHVAPLLAAECCVTAIDLSGHGDSGHREKYRWEDWADEVLEVLALDASSIERPIVIGHSMGGRVGVKVASLAGDQIKGLILIDTAIANTWAPGQSPLPFTAPRPHRRYPSEDEIRRRFRLRPAQTAALPYVFSHIAGTSVREIDDGWTWKFDPKTRDQKGEIGEETLAKISCRVAIVRPEHGRMAPDAHIWFSEVIGQEVPKVEIPAAYHHVMIDQPLPLIEVIRSILVEWNHASAADLDR